MKIPALHSLPYLFLIPVLFGFATASQAAGPAEKARAEALQARVKALSNHGAAGQVRAVLNIAIERVKACTDAGCDADAAALLDNIEAALATNPVSLAAPATDTGTISLLITPKVVDGNPYLQRLLDGARAQLAKPENPWAKNTPDVNTFVGLQGGTGSRSTGEEMEAWLWLFANPASPMKGSPDALARYLRVAHAYADALDVHGGTAEAGKGIFDDFAIAPAANALREFAKLYPGLLLPSQKAQWDRAMANGGRVMFGKAKDRQGEYANIDITLGFELLNFGLYLNNREYLDKAKFLVETQEKNIYPDGAIAYIWHQNESCTYHDADVHYFARYYQITGDEKVREMLLKTEWYGPVSGVRLCEFWTAPSWKDTWNSNRIFCGGEEVASLTGNPFLRKMCDDVLAKPVDPRAWAQNYAPLPWYRNDVKPLPLPDNYTVLDRNIAGPRAWYGRFNYACTTRPTPDTEPGLATLMGAQMTMPDGQLGRIAMDIYPRIRTSPNDLNTDGSFNRFGFASRAAGLKSAVVMGRSFSAVAGAYALQEYRSSSPGKTVDWAGHQLWLGLQDRVIGLVEVEPAGNGAKAIDVEGVVRLGTGGTVNGPPTKIEALGGNSWKYGDLVVSVLAHNYASIKTPEVPFRVPKFPNTEIRLLDDKGAAGATTPSPYPALTHLFYLVEIRPSTVTESARAAVIKLTPGLQGMEVTAGSRRFLLAANLTGGDLSYALPPGFAGGNVSVHNSGSRVVGQARANATLKSMEMQVIVNSPEAEDKLPGWSSYQEMIAAPGKK
jgi:hypothetical protein